MSRADERAEAAILARLGEGPADVVALARAVAAALGPSFARAEGGLHAVLHGLVRTDRVEVADRADAGGAVYALPSAAPDRAAHARSWDERMPGPDAPPPSTRRASRTALRAASGIADPGDRGRVVSDVLAHLASIEAAGGARGFGHVGAARDALRRADRGRRRVALALDASDRVRRFLVHEAPGFLLAAAVFATVWIFLLRPWRIPSGSMEPTLFEGDRIVAWQPGAEEVPERWAVMTFQNPHGTTLIKRVAGIPGDVLRIRGGDLWVGGKVARKPERLREALKQEVLRAGPFGGEPPKGWSRDPRDPGLFRLAGPVVIEEGEMEHAHDVYLDARAPAGEPVELAIEFDALLGDARSPGAAVLRRGPDGTSLVLVGARGEEVVARREAGGDDEDLALSIVDGFVEARSGGWSAERLLDVERGEARVSVRGPVRSLVLSRDLHYTTPGGASYAVENDFEVPAGHVFMLGDHSSDSRDSRYRTLGPVPLSSLSGRAVCRIWPPLRVGPIR